MRFLVLILLLVLAPAWGEQHPCVVCSVEQARIHAEECELSRTWQETVYYFCAQGCLDRFQAEPERWAEGLAALQGKSAKQPTSLPPFKLPLEPIGSVSSQDVEGQVLVLNYWASWCAPCMEEMPDLIKLQEQFGQRGLSVLAFNFDESPEKHRQTVQRLKLNFPSFFAEDKQVRKLLDQLGPADVLPTTLVVDKEGQIVKRLPQATTLEELQQLVQPLLPQQESSEVSQVEPRGSVVPS